MKESDVIAADRMVSKRMSVVMGRAEADGDPRQTRNRLDDADNLRRPEHAAELAKTWREIGNADGGALAVGQNRYDDRRVAPIFRAEVRRLVEDDVGKTFLLVSRQETAE